MKPDEWHDLKDPKVFFFGKMLPDNFAPPDSILFFFRSVNKYVGGKPHNHYRYTVIFPLENVVYFVDNIKFEIGRGEALVIYPFQNRYIHSRRTECDRLYMTFTAEGNQEYLPPPGKYSVTDRAARHLSEALDHYSANDAESLAAECILLLKEFSIQTRIKKETRAFSATVAAALNYISTHLEEPFTIRALAENCHASESNLRLMFRREIGVSPGAYAATLRLNNACQQLKYSRKTIRNIAMLCGFSSVFAFSHFFQRHMKCSPSDYRRNGKSPETGG